LPRAHGSALFTAARPRPSWCDARTGEDEQFIDALEGTYKEHFLLHYNFPPFSVGETGRIGAPGRREVGHGKLAWRAIHPVLPLRTIPLHHRVVSEITSRTARPRCDGMRRFPRADGRRRAVRRRPPASPWASSSRQALRVLSDILATRTISAT